jgi:hypothetical protein
MPRVRSPQRVFLDRQQARDHRHHSLSGDGRLNRRHPGHQEQQRCLGHDHHRAVSAVDRACCPVHWPGRALESRDSSRLSGAEKAVAYVKGALRLAVRASGAARIGCAMTTNSSSVLRVVDGCRGQIQQHADSLRSTNPGAR